MTIVRRASVLGRGDSEVFTLCPFRENGNCRYFRSAYTLRKTPRENTVGTAAYRYVGVRMLPVLHVRCWQPRWCKICFVNTWRSCVPPHVALGWCRGVLESDRKDGVKDMVATKLCLGMIGLRQVSPSGHAFVSTTSEAWYDLPPSPRTHSRRF